MKKHFLAKKRLKNTAQIIISTKTVKSCKTGVFNVIKFIKFRIIQCMFVYLQIYTKKNIFLLKTFILLIISDINLILKITFQIKNSQLKIVSLQISKFEQ